MELELEYFMWLIEKEFYEKNHVADICNAKKGLPCNCLTGLSMNYWGYVIMNCQNMNLGNVFDIKENIICILTTYKEKRIFPIIPDENNQSEYLFYDKVCTKDKVSSEKIYVQGLSSEDYTYMTERFLDVEPNCGNRITEYNPICDFLRCFIKAVRTQSIEKESIVLFAIMLFFFPNRTMKLVLEYMDGAGMEEDKKTYIKEFMDKYDSFLNSLDSCNEYSFCPHFYVSFEALTGIYIGEWIEEIIQRQEDKKFWRGALIAAYNRNVEERRRRTSRYRKVMNFCI